MAQNYVLLERIELNASAASVTFSNIPQSGYTDLKLVMSSRASVTDSSDPYDLIFTFNSTSTIASKVLRGDGTTAASNSITDRILRGGPVPSNYTSNTFSNGEIYIPNYTGSQNKSWSADNVLENNATGTGMSMVAGLTSITAAITTITLAPLAGSFVQYSTFSLYGLAAVGTTPAIAPKASGGNIATDGTYWIHTFNTTGTFVPLQTLSCDYLVVAGGGGGGGYGGFGGGGGAGGYIYQTSQSLTATSYAVTVGAGGAADTSGSNSVFNSSTSIGGGFGGKTGVAGGATGGSGGGGAESTAGSAGTSSQGNAGGTGSATSTGGGGGGGGASANGGSPSNSGGGGAGGSGTANSITGTSTYYAGGGGGSSDANAPGAGGAGGGGTGGKYSTSTAPTAGTANTGGGGGGRVSTPAAAGGSGIVIIRYTIA
jgi:hypothetical protein